MMKVIMQQLKQTEPDMDDEQDYGGWLIEDLKQYHKDLIKDKQPFWITKNLDYPEDFHAVI